MTRPLTNTRPSNRVLLAAFGLLLLLVGASFGAVRLHHADGQRRALLALAPDAVPLHPELVRLARSDAAPLYAEHCASCHGATMRGNAARGAPSLTDAHWMFGSGRVFDIERTILFGIRSTNGKTRNIAEMPAFGQTGVLSRAEIQAVTSYVLSLSHHADDADLAAEGKSIYLGRGYCWDCHGGDARGNPDYGAPDLTTGHWASGDSASTITNSIYYGRHDVCPAWAGILTLLQIRELAVDLYTASHPVAVQAQNKVSHDPA